MSVENHGKSNIFFFFLNCMNIINYLHWFYLDSLYYYYYNEILENVKSIKYSKNSLEYYNDNQKATSAIVMCVF